MIFSVVGKLGCGKSTVAQRIAVHTMFPIIDVGDVVREVVRQRTKRNKFERETLQTEKNNHTDKDWLWNVLEKKIAQQDCIIAGIREPYLLHKLFTIDNNVKCITIEVNDFDRYSRLLIRDGYVTPEQFKQMDQRDEQLGLSIVLAKSDFVISNEHSLSELDNIVERMLGKFQLVSKKSHIK